ncbi:MAG: hypothetical protein K8S55_05175 [Phycisphaerae bacterium]|nr:hypothetical protein [Phycisphaerae bacterium]
MASKGNGITNIDRRELKFEEAVQQHLEPILYQHGFIRVDATPSAVRFETTKVLLVITHDTQLSYEIETTIALRSHPKECYSIQDILEAIIGTQPGESYFFQASTPERVQYCVKNIAELLQKCGDSIFRGDSNIFHRMDMISEARACALEKKIVETPIRRAAVAAWKDKDYVNVVKYYGSIMESLTPSEAKKLEYAKKHL